MTMSGHAAPRVHTSLAVAIFVFTLLAFVIESELTQFVQTTLGYRQPYFIFYIVHSSFTIIFPLHLLYLKFTSPHSTRALFASLSKAITGHLRPHSPNGGFPLFPFLRLVLGMTIGITFPALLWFAAITLASVTDVTAIWNTNAFFAYVITVKLFKLEWETRKLIAVVLATLGTLGVVYGGVENAEPEDVLKRALVSKPSAPLVGDLLTLLASFGYGLYQVMYKKYCALSNDPEVLSHSAYQRILEEDEGNAESDPVDLIPPLPYGFHPNLLTAWIGVITFVTLWIPLPFLHYSGLELFVLPKDFKTVLAIGGISLSGVVFNSGLMILLGVWGPIITSVGSLLTIVLVFISDVIFGAGLEAVTGLSIVGCAVIVVAFGVLAYDVFKQS